MEEIKRVKRSEATWRELFSRQASSGKSVSEFCRVEGINAGLFRRWRAVLDGEGERRRMRRVRAHRKTPAPARPFIKLGGIGSSDSRMQVRLELGGGVVLSIGRG